jgi:hypothetical protein
MSDEPSHLTREEHWTGDLDKDSANSLLLLLEGPFEHGFLTPRENNEQSPLEPESIPKPRIKITIPRSEMNKHSSAHPEVRRSARFHNQTTVPPPSVDNSPSKNSVASANTTLRRSARLSQPVDVSKTSAQVWNETYEKEFAEVWDKTFENFQPVAAAGLSPVPEKKGPWTEKGTWTGTWTWSKQVQFGWMGKFPTPNQNSCTWGRSFGR